MAKTAILVDGGFYRRKFAKGMEHTPSEAADALVSYCYRHLKERHTDHDLYAVFSIMTVNLVERKSFIRCKIRR